MLHSEFHERTGVSLTGEEYAKVEAIYNNVQMDKDEFCSQWQKMKSFPLLQEIAQAMLKMQQECVNYEKQLRERSEQLSEEQRLHGIALERAIEESEERMKSLCRRIISNMDDEQRIYDIIEEEMTLDFIIRVKLEEGFELESHERTRLLTKL